MKKYLKLAVTATALTMVTSASYAANTYKTSTGAVFTQVNGPGVFGQAWSDPNGTIWSASAGYQVEKNPQGPITNPIGVLISAQDYCNRIGGSLPTESDYQRLLSYFETAGGAGFTSQGKTDFSKVFPDAPTNFLPEYKTTDSTNVKNVYFATVTTSPDAYSSGVQFESEYGIISVGGRKGSGAIRCVNHSGNNSYLPTGPLPTVGSPIGSTYKTGKGVKFVRVDGGKFGPAWKDSNGLLWSDFQGDYVNWTGNGTTSHQTIVDSPSVQACAKIGGYVPTGRDFVNLLAQLSDDQATGGYTKDISSLFPFMLSARHFFGSSSIEEPPYLHPMYYFDSYYGRVAYDVIVGNNGHYAPGTSISILCVNQAPHWAPTPVVQPQSPYVTSTGAVFTKVQKAGFGEAWKDPAGVLWSTYRGNYFNLPPNPETTIIITSSDSVTACQNIGGALPSVQDYQRLRTYFDFTTSSGKKDLQAIFPDMQELLDGYPNEASPYLNPRMFASTSNVYYSGSDLSVTSVWSTDLRYSRQAVRCIAP